MNSIIGWIIAAVVLLGGAYYVVQHNNASSDAMMGGPEAGDTMMASSTDTMMASSSDAMMKDEEEGSMMADDTSAMSGDAMMASGSYEAYAPEKLAKADTGSVVLFFRASWCPTCRAVDADIRANLSAIPAKLAILDVDYDTATALKQKYGVTYQHTFVQVDANGKMIKKWSGSPTLAALVAEVR